MNLDEMLANLEKSILALDKDKKDENKDTTYKKYLEQYISTGDINYLKQYVTSINYSSNIDLESALLEKVNSNPVIYDIIKNNIYMSIQLKRTIFKNKELLNIVLNEKYSNVFSGMKEEEYLIMHEGKTILEHLIINNMFKAYDVRDIKNSDIILDMILKYNLKDYFSNLDENQLFKVYKGKLVIEFMFEHNLVDFMTISHITKHPEIYDYIIKYNRLDLLSIIKEEIQIQKREGKYIFDLIIENGKKPKTNQLESEELINLIIERQRYDLLVDLSSDKLKEPYLEYDSMFEFLIINGIVPSRAIYEIENERTNMKFFYEIIEKHNKFELLQGVRESSLLKKYNEKETLLEILLSKGLTPKTRSYNKKETLDILYSLNNFEELQKCDSKLQNTILPNGKMLCEELLERNLDPGSKLNESEEITKKIFEYKRYGLYTKLNINQLFKLANLNETYMDILLEESKINDEIQLFEIANRSYNAKNEAKVYITFAKHDLHMHLKRLDKDELLSGDLLKELLSLDKDLTVEKILSRDVKEDIDIAMIIKFAGVNHDKIKFESHTKSIEEEYLISNIEEYESLPLTQEQEMLLSSLEQVMSDGKSDPKILRAFMATYRHLLATNSPHAYEIIHLINIKQNNDRFAYQRINNGAYFSPYYGTVSMDDENIDTLNHETGHALFRYLTNEEIPQEFNTVMQQLKNDEECLRKTAEYSKKLELIRKEVEEQVERDFMPIYDSSITDETKQEIQQYLNTLTSEQKHLYMQKGYSEETLDLIFSKTFTIDEYLKQDRRVKKEEMIDLILRTKYGSFLSIGDYLDGIYVGRLNAGILKDTNGNKIGRTYGHGIYYYSRGSEWAFNEMIANYSSTAKSKNPKEDLEMLKHYIGDELFNIIQTYYMQQILQSKQYTNETSITL